MKSKIVLWAAIAILLGVVGFLAFRPTGGEGLVEADGARVREAIADGAQIIDVRTAGEYQLGHIPGATNVPLDQLETQAGGWDKDATYVVYCQSGSRSVTAVGILNRLGIENIVHLTQGMDVWDGEVEQGQASGAGTFKTQGRPMLVEFSSNS